MVTLDTRTVCSPTSRALLSLSPATTFMSEALYVRDNFYSLYMKYIYTFAPETKYMYIRVCYRQIQYKGNVKAFYVN